jgi:hypothetical protein
MWRLGSTPSVITRVRYPEAGAGVRLVMRCGNRSPTRSGRPVQIVTDDRLEEVAPLHGTGKHLRQADVHLLEREPVGVTGGPIDRGQRRGQPRGPAIEERLHVSRSEAIADRLEPRGVGTREEAVVETVKGHVGAPQLLLHPLVAVEAQLDRIGQIRPKLDERRAPLRILDVEVVMIDGHPLPREVEGDATLRARSLVRLERPHLFLRHADHHHALGDRSTRPIVRHDVVFALTALEGDERHVLGRCVGFDRPDEAVEHGQEQRRGGDRMAPVIAEEVAQAAGRLELRHVGVQVEAVETANGQGHVVANKLVDVGHQRLLLAKKSPDATPPGVRRCH